MSLLKRLFGKKEEDALTEVRALVAAGDSRQARKLLEAHPESLAHLVMLREMTLGEGDSDTAASIAGRIAEQGEHAERFVSLALLAHLSGDFATAVEHCENALTRQRDLATACNHLGRSLHNLGRPDEALSAFRRATSLQPAYAEAWHNQGHALRAQGSMDEAIAAFAQALKIAPGFRMARLNLGITQFNLEMGTEALENFEALLESDPDDVEALVNAGLCKQMLGRFDDARACYEEAIAKAPSMATAHYYLGVLMNERMQTNAAIQSLERALELAPDDVEVLVELVGVYEQSNELGKAAETLAQAEKRAPGHPALQLEAAKLERRKGNVEAAVSRLESMNPRHLPPRLAQQYFFELGLGLDRTGDADAAYRAFEQGNMLAAQSPRRETVDDSAFPQECERLLGWVTQHASSPSGSSGSADDGEDICFMVGFPRSGTTLLDTMLDVLPDVVSIEEQPTIEIVISRIEQVVGPYPESIAKLDDEDITSLRALYRETIGKLVEIPDDGLVVDKLPLRSIHAALIHTLFPKAKILFSLRHPCDVALSNFMQQYAVNEAFVHFDTLEDCCRTYDDVMRVWQATEDRLPLNAFHLRYEDLVQEPEKTLDQVCAFLGIERTDEMLDHEARLKARGRIRTNSYQQVAEPLYKRASGRWQRYRNHLEPYLPLLQPHVERYGYKLDT